MGHIPPGACRPESVLLQRVLLGAGAKATCPLPRLPAAREKNGFQNALHQHFSPQTLSPFAMTTERFASTTGENETILLPDQEKAYKTPQGTQYKNVPLGAVDLTPDPTAVRGEARIQALKEHPAFGVRFRSVDHLEEKMEEVSSEGSESESRPEENSSETESGTADTEAAEGGHRPEDPPDDDGEPGESELKTLGYTNPNQAVAYLARETGASEAEIDEIRGEPALIRAFAQEHGYDFPELEA